MIDMVKAMARLAPEQRKTLLGERLRLFAEASEEERARGMLEMRAALVTLPRAEQKKLIGTRMQVLLELPDTARNALLGTHMRLMSGMPEEAQVGEVSILNELMEEMPPQMRAVANEKMGGMMTSMLHQFHSRQGRTYDWCGACQISG